MSIQKVWEIGGTVFASASALQSLINATSKDDVHPQAVRVAEALGDLMIVDPKRIADGVDALGGNESIRLEELQVTVGLDFGCTRRVMRQIPGLVKFFLLATACKLSFTDQQIGDIMFAMLDSAGLIDKLVVSPSQIQRLISQVSGHSDSIIPVDLYHYVAVELDRLHPGPDIFRPLTSSALAELIVHLFEELRDDTTVNILLIGHAHGIWMATAVLWLLGDNANLDIDGSIVQGNADAKVTMKVLANKSSDLWTMKSYKADKNVIDHVYECASDEHGSVSRLPMNSTAQLLDQHYWSDFDHNIRRTSRSLCGIFTMAVVDHLLTYGYIRAQESTMLTASLESLLPLRKRYAVQPLLEAYGWAAQTPTERELTEEITAELRPCGLRKAQKGSLIEVCTRFLLAYGLDAEYLEQILEPALYVALDAILTSIVVSDDKGFRRFMPSLDSWHIMEEQDDLFDQLLSRSLTSSKFHDAALRRLLPGLQSVSEEDLIVCHDGLVAGPTCFWRLEQSPPKLFGIKVLPGDIRKDGICYDKIVEADFLVKRLGNPQALDYTMCGRHAALESAIPSNKEQYILETALAISGRSLEVKQYLTKLLPSSKVKSRQKISWKTAAFTLALAERHTSLNQQYHSSRAIEQRPLGLQWTSPLDALAHDIPACSKILMPTWSMPTLAMAAAYMFSECRALCEPHTAKLLVHQSGSLASTVRHAMDHDGSVVIIIL